MQLVSWQTYLGKCTIWRRLAWNRCARQRSDRKSKQGWFPKSYALSPQSYVFSSCDDFVGLPHTITDSQLAEFEAVDPFIEQFNASLDKQIASFESVLHTENFQVSGLLTGTSRI